MAVAKRTTKQTAPIPSTPTNLLNEVLRVISVHPEAFSIDSDEYDIAGWVVYLAGKHSPDIYEEARRLLCISKAQADALFLHCNWPVKFRRGFEPEPTSRRQFETNARLATARISLFMQKEMAA